MEQEQDLTTYRGQLLNRVQAGNRRSTREPSEQLHLFINDRRAGQLDVAGSSATLRVQHPTAIHTVHLRSEDGVLLGGLCAPECGRKHTRIALGHEIVDLDVHNQPQGGSVNALFTPAPPLWHRMRERLRGVSQVRGLHHVPSYTPGLRSIAFTQALIALVLVAFAADRFAAGMSADPTPPPLTHAQAPWVAPLAEVEKLERRLTDMMQLQTNAIDTIQAQQQSMAQMQRTIAKLSSAQDTVASGVLTVQREIEKRDRGVGREVDRMSRILLSRNQNAQEELQAEIHSLTIANDRLSKERLDLERNNKELKQRLKAAGIDVSKATPSKAAGGDLAQRREDPTGTQIVDGRRIQDAQPLQFWVTFQEGTTEDSIERLVREVHGRRGSVTEGWQALEILLPVESKDRFLDKIREAKIVKAVRTVEAR